MYIPCILGIVFVQSSLIYRLTLHSPSSNGYKENCFSGRWIFTWTQSLVFWIFIDVYGEWWLVLLISPLKWTHPYKQVWVAIAWWDFHIDISESVFPDILRHSLNNFKTRSIAWESKRLNVIVSDSYSDVGTAASFSLSLALYQTLVISSQFTIEFFDCGKYLVKPYQNTIIIVCLSFALFGDRRNWIAHPNNKQIKKENKKT